MSCIKIFSKLMGVTLGIMAGSVVALGTERDHAVGALNALTKPAALSRLEASLESPAGGSAAVGQPLELRLKFNQPSYLTLVLVDAHGVVQIAQPSVGTAGNFVAAPGELYLPTSDRDIPLLVARPPEGTTDVFVLASEQQLKVEGRPTGDTQDRMFDVQQGKQVVEALADQLNRGGQITGSVVHLPLRVTSAANGQGYTPEQIVQYFTQTTRSIARPRLDLHLNFNFNSTELTKDSMQRLETWARVLKDPLLTNQRFLIGGHTDDIGTDEYNQRLSEERAAAIRDTLISRYGVPAGKLTIAGYGMSRPLVDGASEADRALNRRVDFERLSVP